MVTVMLFAPLLFFCIGSLFGKLLHVLVRHFDEKRSTTVLFSCTYILQFHASFFIFFLLYRQS